MGVMPGYGEDEALKLALEVERTSAGRVRVDAGAAGVVKPVVVVARRCVSDVGNRIAHDMLLPAARSSLCVPRAGRSASLV